MKQILPGFYTFTGLVIGRVYLIEGPDGLTLVDTGIESAPGKILSQLANHGKKPEDVKRILITHAHPDHVGGLHLLKEKTGASVVASAPEAEVIEGRIPVPRAPAAELSGLSRLMRPTETRYEPVKVDRIVEGGDVIEETMGGLQVIFTPGHAPGHLAFWQSEKRVLILGDVLFNTPRMRLPPAALTVDMVQNRRSVQKAADLKPDVICFGHGVPIMRNAAEKIKAVAARVNT